MEVLPLGYGVLVCVLAAATGFKHATRVSQLGVAAVRFGILRNSEVIQKAQALKSWIGKQKLPVFQAKHFQLSWPQ